MRQTNKGQKMWKFQITTGNMYDPAGALISTGYAGGNQGKNPEGKDNPADESVRNIGPIPEGIYTFGPLRLQYPKLGAYCFPLIPDPGNQMYGRSGFFCHGDTTPPGNASDGCIIQPHSTRQAMYISTDQTL
jgi:hypothetical protein